MNLMEQYLNERENFFYPNSNKVDDNVATKNMNFDFDRDYLGKDKVSDSINTKGIIDVSVPILDPSDFMKSNTDMQTYYSQGKGFDVADNSGLYEVIKLVKDMTDKHLYVKDIVWKVDIANRQAVFTFTLGDSETPDEGNDFFLQGIQQYIIAELIRKYGPLYKIDTEFLKNEVGQKVMKMTVKQNTDQERTIQKKIYGRVPNSPSFSSDKSSISSM